mmetsp:Transcript_7424/g.16595  ORF Transcript_7424/g.16595 Transcript_7424/m.16595 type:complete len:253 (-) Transcript_7424:282-1040(-)
MVTSLLWWTATSLRQRLRPRPRPASLSYWQAATGQTHSTPSPRCCLSTHSSPSPSPTCPPRRVSLSRLRGPKCMRRHRARWARTARSSLFPWSVSPSMRLRGRRLQLCRQPSGVRMAASCCRRESSGRMARISSQPLRVRRGPHRMRTPRHRRSAGVLCDSGRPHTCTPWVLPGSRRRSACRRLPGLLAPYLIGQAGRASGWASKQLRRAARRRVVRPQSAQAGTTSHVRSATAPLHISEMARTGLGWGGRC